MVPPKASLEVRHEPEADVWIVASAGNVIAYGRIVYPHGTEAARNVTVKDVPTAFSPPRGWIGTALLGLVFGLAALLSRALTGRGRAILRAGRPATLDEGGQLRFDDGSTVRLPPGVSLQPGRVVVAASFVEAATYRDAGAVRGVVFQGDKEALLRAVDAEQAAHGAVAIAVLLLGAAPLVAALAAKLLF
jgi:hypothetical protein